MTIYPKPFHYTLSHFLIGVTASYYAWVGILAVIYQVTQFALNVRFFPLEQKIEQGNSIDHTLVKLSEIGLGYLFGRIIQ